LGRCAAMLDKTKIVSDATLQKLLAPSIRLFGNVNDVMFSNFQAQLDDALKTDNDIIVELSTTGGDAETGRRIALDLRLASEYRKKNLLFIGKSFIYSAGVTVMSAFKKEERFLSKDCLLLIHSRRTDQTVHYNGPLTSNLQLAEEMLASLKSGIRLECLGFQNLAEGSELNADDIMKKASQNWCLEAEEALKLGLVQGLI
jgi:ATP-dependent protease ClpP protease subunit